MSKKPTLPVEAAAHPVRRKDQLRLVDPKTGKLQVINLPPTRFGK